MIKDKLSSAIPPEDVIIRKSNLVETCADPEGDRVLHKHRLPLIMIASVLILVFAAAAVMSYWTKPVHANTIDINMFAVRMNENGRLSAEGSAVIHGDRLNYRDKTQAAEFHASELTLLN